ncbi:MAG: glycosyltransferase family 61 protein [Bacteroidota bacterium]
MNKRIHVDMPGNITATEAGLFTPYADYEIEDLKILYLEEVFVTYTGLCIDETGVRKESHHAYSDKQDVFLNDAVVQFKQALNDPGKLIELDDDETYLLIHHPWAANYWHWLTEVILRVWMVRDCSHNMILILPANMKSTTFVKQSLAAFRFKEVFYIPEGNHLLVRKLCVPEVKRFADSYYPGELHDIRRHYLERRSAVTGNHSDKLYISRKKATKRRVVNEDEVEKMLRKYGFDCINNEDFDFHGQVSLFSTAKYVISIHGAGLTNMLFMKENSQVLELHKKRTNDYDWHSFAFWYMSNALGFKYHQQVCEPEDPRSSFFDANFVVDVKLLEHNVRFMLGLL